MGNIITFIGIALAVFNSVTGFQNYDNNFVGETGTDRSLFMVVWFLLVVVSLLTLIATVKKARGKKLKALPIAILVISLLMLPLSSYTFNLIPQFLMIIGAGIQMIVAIKMNYKEV